ncbi:MAG: hypothetical protein IJ514_01530 [Clostridia bacterium]|nr:hypothetical protein [Clostridia bacterium]
MSNPVVGVIALIVLFILCFFFVHIARLVKFGWSYQKTAAPPKEKEEKPKEKAPAEQKPQEPIYYIVERKRRTQSSFSEPKQIRFK